MYLFDPEAKIHKDTCRYLKIHSIHRPHKIVKTEKNHLPNFSLEFEFSNSRGKGDSDSLYVDQQSANGDHQSANADQRSAQENACR